MGKQKRTLVKTGDDFVLDLVNQQCYEQSNKCILHNERTVI